MTPAWALECWLWEDDHNTAEFVDELLEGYRKHDIPVRTVILDSPWSHRYNDFRVDTLLYPNYKDWFAEKKEQGYRLVLWMTPNVNRYSKGLREPDSEEWYNQADSKGYLVKGKPTKWWKGEGGFIDYTDQKAMEWWRSMQQNVFDLGIDGWKLDGSATLFANNLWGIPFFYKKGSQGWMNTRTYMDLYYREEYLHGLTQNPEFVTLSRALDRWYHPEGFSPIEASPVNWVGDQKHEWRTAEMLNQEEERTDIALDGIEDFESAIKSILNSAKLGYNIIGSDIAGFSGSEIPARLYIRWAQFSTFCGLFLNGGHGERRLWLRSKQELDLIRKFSWLHTELVPYMYHYVVKAHSGGRRLQVPIGKGYQYMFGDYLLVAPIYEDRKNWEVDLPEGNWRYFFDDMDLLEGGQRLERDFPLKEFPVYVKEGAIIPMHISKSYSGIGEARDKGKLTLLCYPGSEYSAFTVYREQEESTKVELLPGSKSLKVNLSGKKTPHVLRIKLEGSPKVVNLDGASLASEEDFSYDLSRKQLVIRTEEYQVGEYLIEW
ncbi:TIM-barrel domain-containing protein [Pleomorphovibrio marinus]|uniref:TIM-barrel domain-containing protein n=1 Tax=Pleomorphovibrio marinus TaxID=2164132 RepID=UPI001E3FFB70|nr:TIM-barrel domain-containing protein [Pleomorphovibrio marinus]